MSPKTITHLPYVGVTGFMNREEVNELLNGFEGIGLDAKVMVGVLISDTTLGGKLNKHPHSFPKREDIATIFTDHNVALNLLHYNTHDTTDLASQLVEAMKWGGPNCQGFQLNIAWPDPGELVEFRKHYPDAVIVLQIGKQAFEELNGDIGRLAQKLSIEYKELIDYVLFDMSGGVGVDLDIELCQSYISHLTNLNLHEWFGIGVAGGLCSVNVLSLGRLFSIYPELCIDAQGKLRDDQGKLDIIEAYEYLLYALMFFHT